MKPLAIDSYTLTSAAGRGRAAHLAALRAERTGLAERRFEDAELATWIGAVAGLESVTLPRELAAFDCRNNRLAELALTTDGFLEAVAAARDRHGARRIGVFIGTSTSGVRHTEIAYRERGGDSLPDWFDYRTTQNTYSIADYTRARLGLDGVTVAVSAACASSGKVFASAARAIEAGFCDAAVVGGVDTLCLTTLYGFNSLQLVSSDICRPADPGRKGLSIGEAGGFALLTPAPQPGVTACLGCGETSDAHHMSQPRPDGALAAQAMARAMGDLPHERLGYINLHGTATPANDASEDAAVSALFGTTTPCSSTKGWTGHTLGAAGIVEAAICLLAMEHGFLPRSLNTREKDPALKANILMTAREAPVEYALSNSFGFGGTNCSVLLGPAP
ncbi:MAG TPA: beta-ketoacyl-ACP synthase [Steroidobacteraceae bacterium]|nr:beta-ketoacyl-ACP synthase [Steroidobacteraceae bacterium]